ncbi:MAG TPA: hypothetical protein VHD87_12895 [Acidimicrobiales bacterium]|nr:hypothetical protein [Acidimicrobiales bacterium]
MHLPERPFDDLGDDDWIDALLDEGFRPDPFELPEPAAPGGDELDLLLERFDNMAETATAKLARRFGVPVDAVEDHEVDLYDFDADNAGRFGAYEPADPRADELTAILTANPAEHLGLHVAAYDWLLADYPKPPITDTYRVPAQTIAGYLLSLTPALRASVWFSDTEADIYAALDDSAVDDTEEDRWAR